MSGKGSAPRPFSVSADEYADRFDAIFGKKQLGLGRAAQASGSNPDQVGSTPTAPAIYVDADTLQEVTEEWWPTVTTNQEQSA